MIDFESYDVARDLKGGRNTCTNRVVGFLSSDQEGARLVFIDHLGLCTVNKTKRLPFAKPNRPRKAFRAFQRTNCCEGLDSIVLRPDHAVSFFGNVRGNGGNIFGYEHIRRAWRDDWRDFRSAVRGVNGKSIGWIGGYRRGIRGAYALDARPALLKSGIVTVFHLLWLKHLISWRNNRRFGSYVHCFERIVSPPGGDFPPRGLL